ncbi:MAG: squalene synthase HpnC [Burkholderiales bacterium PBB1]|nr:MAG: squalene synthase HpnC [Burkholderiales bacterium PBB1]
MSVEHYENFPVASWLCPAPLRGTVAAIYWFARTADDIADEGNAPAAQRLADLSAYRADLATVAAGNTPSPRWQTVFGPLSEAMARHHLPVALLADLLSAFEQDVVKTRYADRAEVLNYCSRSANPVGRLLLHLYGVSDAESLAQSDAICTALQLINFWQDVGIDTARGRLYLPLADIASHGLSVESLLARQDSPATRGLIAEMTAWARTLMLQGAPLVHRVAGRAGWELRLVVQGGLRIADKIEHMDYATLQQRPRIGKADAPLLLWRAARMRATTTTLTRKTA